MAKPTLVPNRVSAIVSDADLVEIMKAIKLLNDKLWFLVGLTEEERQAMLKAGPKSRDFTHKSFALAEKIPDYLPKAFDLDEFRKDVNLLDKLHPIHIEISKLSSKLGDTYSIVSSEGYAAGLIAYRHGKDAAGAEGLEEVMNELGARFARKAGKKDDEASTNPPKQ